MWDNLPIVEEFVASHQLMVITVVITLSLIFWRNISLKKKAKKGVNEAGNKTSHLPYRIRLVRVIKTSVVGVCKAIARFLRR